MKNNINAEAARKLADLADENEKRYWDNLPTTLFDEALLTIRVRAGRGDRSIGLGQLIQSSKDPCVDIPSDVVEKVVEQLQANGFEVRRFLFWRIVKW